MNDVDKKLLEEMTEESGDMWAAMARARSRSAMDTGNAGCVIICRNPERAWYLERTQNLDIPHINGWVVQERPLKMSDAAEFFAAFGDHWLYWLGAVVRNAPLRAFVKNGRREGWSISLDVKPEPLEGQGVDGLSWRILKDTPGQRVRNIKG